MRRRDFIALTGVAGAAAAFPRFALAQQAARMPRVVYLALSTPPARAQALRDGLADVGYVDAKNITVEFVNAGTIQNLAGAAAAVVAGKPDIVVPAGAEAARAARDATTTIPIVFVNVGDPVGIGLVPSLPHPGGNVTGTSSSYTDLAGKQVSILYEVVPTMKRMAVLYAADSPAVVRTAEQVRAAATALGIEAVLIGFSDTLEIAPQFDSVVAAGTHAAFVTSSQYFTVVDNNNSLHDLLLKARLPAISQAISTAAHPVVGVVAYGASPIANTRRAGLFIDAILKGARPGDLPVELPTVFDFAVDLATAKAMGITITSSILAQATQVIE